MSLNSFDPILGNAGQSRRDCCGMYLLLEERGVIDVTALLPSVEPVAVRFHLRSRTSAWVILVQEQCQVWQWCVMVGKLHRR